MSLPPTPAEALARAQLLLDFPPAAEKHEEWRAIIQSLNYWFANKDGHQEAGPSRRRSTEPARANGGRNGGVATMVHSPPPRRQRSPARRADARDEGSTASSYPRACRDQRQVLREQVKEDARTTIEQRREARHQSDRRTGPTVDRPESGDSGDLPYEVGCPAFTRELWRFQWPMTCMFKPEVPEKYNGKTHPYEFLSIYTIAMQAAGARDGKVLSN